MTCRCYRAGWLGGGHDDDKCPYYRAELAEALQRMEERIKKEKEMEDALCDCWICRYSERPFTMNGCPHRHFAHQGDSEEKVAYLASAEYERNHKLQMSRPKLDTNANPFGPPKFLPEEENQMDDEKAPENDEPRIPTLWPVGIAMIERHRITEHCEAKGNIWIWVNEDPMATTHRILVKCGTCGGDISIKPLEPLELKV